MDNYRPMQKNMAEWRTPQMVHFIGSGIPDLVVGLIIFCIVISGALRILKLSK